ncbi:MAG: phytanoyl-CoA dioxygenase family protein [Isosphaeraceae bacterium]
MGKTLAQSLSGLRKEALNGLGNRIFSNRRHQPPAEPVLTIDSPPDGAVVTGLLPVTGWAFAGSAVAPEGFVEVALDDEENWARLTIRTHVGGVSPEARWAKRCGYQTAVNSFFLENGEHCIKVRLKDLWGRVVLERERSFRVDNVGRLAETTARLLKGHPKAKRIWTHLIDSTDFPYEAGRDVAWIDRPDADARVPEVLSRHGLGSRYVEHLRHFVNEGYLVLDDFVPREWCEQVNRDLESLIGSGTLQYDRKGQRVEKLFEHSKATRDLWSHVEILKILSAIFDDVALPCQTLNFIHGSQQDAHQDLIHLTPFPAGMMCGVWIALEDIHPDAGPLVVYPGSHRLTRLYSHTVPVDKVRGDDWAAFVSEYSPRLMNLINDAGLEPFYYTPKAGSVLIWHEVLAHGGSHRKNDNLTRRSMVSHYFARGGMAYYDAVGQPGWTHED